MDWIPIAERLPENGEEVEVATFHGDGVTFSSTTMQWTAITPVFKMRAVFRHPPSWTHWKPAHKENGQ